ncbi:hypothetical protein E0485_09980 [Paenibacillus albiflavus]|uniref:ABC transporter permease n=1 Tax=Paenibacillus albiflavus TaxID=2545760 RepID=A0A4R4ECW2_9BACL|nr:hypothetical protein [Paenibacillus albiflavus]TCZ77794.1 hypothetical protein E0485_09980 [Paenibacillus albiflavus]
MSLWNGAWYLAKRDLVKDKSVFLWGILFSGVIILFTLDYLIVRSLEKDHVINLFSIIQNTIIVLLFQTLGFGYDRNYFTKYNQTDFFTRRYSYLSTMPISIKQLILARYIQHTITLVVMYAIIFGITGIWGNLIHPGTLTVVQFIEFMLMWVGYTSLFGSIYIFLELGFHGKIYYAISIVVSISMLVGCIVLGFLQVSVWQVAIDLIVSYGYLVTCASLLLAGVVTWLMIKLLARRMQTRDLYI